MFSYSFGEIRMDWMESNGLQELSLVCSHFHSFNSIHNLVGSCHGGPAGRHHCEMIGIERTDSSNMAVELNSFYPNNSSSFMRFPFHACCWMNLKLKYTTATALIRTIRDFLLSTDILASTLTGAHAQKADYTCNVVFFTFHTIVVSLLLIAILYSSLSSRFISWLFTIWIPADQWDCV